VETWDKLIISRMLWITALFAAVLFIPAVLLEHQPVYAQHPTLSIPTVTGTPEGPMASVKASLIFIPVRSGPGQTYPQIGVMVENQRLPALGSTSEGDWVKIVYPGVPEGVGWVHNHLVDVTKSLRVVDAPPTPTPRVTPTLNPTLAAQVIIDVEPTRLPTFTPAPPVIQPTFPAQETSLLAGRNIPMGFVIIGLAVVGFFGTVISLLRGR
jgi:hypothetical protein